MATYNASMNNYDDPERIQQMQTQMIAQNNSPATAATGQQSNNNNGLNYITGAGQASGDVSHYGQGSLVWGNDNSITRILNGNAYPVYVGEPKYQSIYNEYVSRYGLPQQVQQATIPQYEDVSKDEFYQEQLKNYQEIIDKLTSQQYQPVDVEAQVANTMDYEQAYDLAKQIIEPQYAENYQTAANTSAQNLARAGLYDSLYGQALASEAQQNVTRDMNSAIGTLALELQQMDYDQAMQLAQLMVNENQFGANYNQNNMSAAMSGTMNIINSLIDQASMRNDFALQQSALQLQQQAQDLERQYTIGQITQMEYENQLMQLEIEAQRMQNQAIAVGGNTGSGDYVASDTPSSYDPAVAEIQRELVAAGYNIVIDGIMGPATQDALNKYRGGGNNSTSVPNAFDAGVIDKSIIGVINQVLHGLLERGASEDELNQYINGWIKSYPDVEEDIWNLVKWYDNQLNN